MSRDKEDRWGKVVGIISIGVLTVFVLILLLWPSKVYAQTQGINAGGLRTLPANIRDWHLHLLAGAGVELVRSDASGNQDEWVAALARHGLRWAPMLGYNPNGSFNAPNEHLFTSYGYGYVARYGHHGSFWRENPDLPYLPVQRWEVWNEPNTNLFWKPKPDPVRYAHLFTAAKAMIKRYDRDAKVISGGLLRDDISYLKKMLAAGAKPDAIGLHPYYSEIVEIHRSIEWVKSATDLPIAVTEVGWTYKSALWYRRLMRMLSHQKHVVEVMPYAWIAPDWGLATESGPARTGQAYLDAIGR